ncbi:transducin/WD40 repeat-like superfamily protein [Wolffia australiana]
MVLVAGSYERFIWGFSLKSPNPNPNPNPHHDDDENGGGGGGNGGGGGGGNGGGGGILKALFSYPSHGGPIKCVAVAGPVAVSGGADDAVKIYDLATCSEIGSVTDFGGGAVTAAAFHAPPALSFPRNLVTGSDSGAVSIYDVDPFVLLKTIPRVHKRAAAVADVAVHPSGRLALSVARGDAGLALINLVRGRRSFACRLPREAALVRFSPASGDRFVIAAGDRLSIHAAEDAREEGSATAQRRILSIAPIKEKVVVTGEEGGDVTAWDLESGGKAAFCIRSAHSARVKGVVAMGSEGRLVVASASSDGVVRAWDTRMVAGTGPSPHLAEIRTKSRLTCLAGPAFKL